VLGAFVSVAVASMGIYHRTAEGRRRGHDASGRGGSFVLGFFVRDWFYWFLKPLRHAAYMSGASPLAFNFLGLLLALGSGIAIALGHLPLGGTLILCSGIADVLDGDLARRRGVVSAAGAFIDSTFDRFAEVFAFAGLAWFFGSGTPVMLVLVGMGGSLLVSYTRARGESVGVLCKLGVLQRAERMILLSVGTILDPAISQAAGHPSGWLTVWVLWIIAIGTLGTAIFRTAWIARRLGEIDSR
jgi:CDP-diacylglycerol--glycerol-3-phosphate 3-phosphatidyltransferase